MKGKLYSLITEYNAIKNILNNTKLLKGDYYEASKNDQKDHFGDACIIICNTRADAVAKSGARLVSLSALMTTTVPAMEETVRLLNKTCPDCKTMVGGAVLTQEYADAMGADFYGPDAIAAVKFACAVRDGK